MDFDKFGNMTRLREGYGPCVDLQYNGWNYSMTLETGGQTYQLFDVATPHVLTLPGDVTVHVDGSGLGHQRSFPGVATLQFDRDGNNRLNQVTANGLPAMAMTYVQTLSSP